MKLKITEFGIELHPETEYERGCLKHLDQKAPVEYDVRIEFEDNWNRTGYLRIEGHPPTDEDDK